MKQEQNAEKQATKETDGEAEVLAKIAAMPAPYRAMGERLHNIITKRAPELMPRLWYGAPAYAKDGKTVCFFRADRYMTFGFTEDANLTREEGVLHQLVASAYRIPILDESTEAKLGALVRQVAS